MSETSIDASALDHPLDFPIEFKQWLADYVGVNIPKLPVGQVFGFDLQKVKTATIDATQTRGTSTYGDLATVGPTLDKIANGWYLLMFGCDISSASAAITAYNWMSLEINGVAASDADGVSEAAYYTSPTSVMRVLLVHLTTNDLNTMTAKYKAAAGITASFSMRFLHAFKVLSLDA